MKVECENVLEITLGHGGVGIAIGKSKGSDKMNLLAFSELDREYSIGEKPDTKVKPNVRVVIKFENASSAMVLKKQVDAIVDALGPSPSTTPLTLEHGFDITNADGTPIDYDALGRKYKDKLCYCDIDGFYIGEDGQLVLMDDCGASVSVDRGDYHILARKPEEGE